MSILHAEILEQPAVIRRLLEAEAERVMALGRQLAARDLRYVVIAARGTSDNAARYGQYLFGAFNQLTVALAAPSLFSVYHRPPRLEGALVIGISQSGQSPDIVSVIAEGRRQGAASVALTNDPASPLAQAAEHVIRLHAGAERSVAATKTYTAQLAALALLSLSLTPAVERERELAAVPRWMEQALQVEPEAQAAAMRLAASQRCVALGRGFNFATAYEAALKIKELAYLPTEPYSSADFQHGPLAMVEPGFPVIVFAVGEAVRGELLALRDELRARGATLVVLSDDAAARHPAEAWLALPSEAPEWLSPLVSILPAQLLALHLARARGSNPDQPRAIRKVTLTR